MSTTTIFRETVTASTVSSDEILRIQKSLQEKGYAQTNDASLGLATDLRQHIRTTFYTDELLGPEVKGLPPYNRLRVRDVIEYRRTLSGELLFKEHPVTSLRPLREFGIYTRREYSRTYVLEDSEFITWISTMQSVIPIEEQQDHGTMCINFTRTFHDVVARKHQDDEQFIIVYVVARETDGAVTSLHPIDDPEETTVAVTLQPGEYLIFRDRDFMHDVTPQQPRFEGDQHHRDTIISLFHYPGTYLYPDQQ